MQLPPGEVRRIVHLKLSPDFPPEVQEAVVVRDETGECSGLVRSRGGSGVVEQRVSLKSETVNWPATPAYGRLLDALRQLSRSME